MTPQAWFGHSYKGFGSGLRNARSLRLERLCLYAIASSGVSNSKAFVLSSSDVKKSSLPHCVHTTLIANLSSISSLLNTHYTIEGMKWASETKRKDLASFRVSSLFKVVTCNDALDPSPASLTRQTREFHNLISIITAKDVFVKRLAFLSESQCYGGGSGVRTRVSCGTSSGFKPARFIRSRIPPSVLTIRKHKSKDILIVPIVKPKDKPGILCSIRCARA